MKLTDAIRVWDELHRLNVGELGYCDLEKAIEKIVGIENDICGECGEQPRPEKKEMENLTEEEIAEKYSSEPLPQEGSMVYFPDGYCNPQKKL